jgi:hypothetical protein
VVPIRAHHGQVAVKYGYVFLITVKILTRRTVIKIGKTVKFNMLVGFEIPTLMPMLTSEREHLPSPTRPAFLEKFFSLVSC